MAAVVVRDDALQYSRGGLGGVVTGESCWSKALKAQGGNESKVSRGRDYRWKKRKTKSKGAERRWEFVGGEAVQEDGGIGQKLRG